MLPASPERSHLPAEQLPTPNDPVAAASAAPSSSSASAPSPSPAPHAALDMNTSTTDSEAEPMMRHLLLQAQVQQAQLQAMAQAQAQAQASSDVAVPPQLSVEAGTTPMDLLPLSAAAVVIASPTNRDRPLNPMPHVPPNASQRILRRKSIPLSMKKQAIEWIMGPGKGVPSRAEKHFNALNWEVSASSFRKWWKNRDRIMNDSSSKKRISGGGRKPYLEEAEEKLLVIVIQERAKKDRVTRKWIAKTAQHMFQRTNASFKASENWVTKFIRRNGLTLKRSYVTYDQGEELMDATNVASMELVDGMGMGMEATAVTTVPTEGQVVVDGSADSIMQDASEEKDKVDLSSQLGIKQSMAI